MDEPQNISGEKCRDCGNDISATLAADEPVCPNCGCYFRTPVIDGMKKGWLWALFFVVFLGTPGLTFLFARNGLSMSVSVFLTGTFVAAGILSRLCSQDRWVRIVMTIYFGVLLLLVYGGIAFVGCSYFKWRRFE